jgi:hypothetical protein
MFNRVPKSPRRSAVRALAVLGVAATSLGVAATAANAASLPATLSALSGTAAGGNTLTAVVSTAKFFSGAVFAEFEVPATATGSCATTYASPAALTATSGALAISSVKILSSTKLALTVPTPQGGATTLLPNGSSTLGMLVCIYSTNDNTGTLLANAKYTIANAPTIAGANWITPVSGPALGGGTVKVTGTNFVSTTANPLTASLGGAALTNVSLLNSTSFTATVPAHTAGAVTLSVTTVGGTATKSNAYTYSNGIVISPNTTPTNTTATDIDVQGVGFSGMDFSTTTGANADNTKAHVYLVAGSYDPTDNAGAKTKAETAECMNVLVISDNELICTLNTTDAFAQGGGSPVQVVDGTYTLTVVNDGGIDVQPGGGSADPNYAKTVVSSGSTFTVAPY